MCVVVGSSVCIKWRKNDELSLLVEKFKKSFKKELFGGGLVLVIFKHKRTPDRDAKEEEEERKKKNTRQRHKRSLS